MQVVNNRALLLVTQEPEQITNLIPKSTVVSTSDAGAEVLVDWSFDSWRILRNLGFENAPHPILGRYKWPGVYTPFDHQRATAAFFASHPRCYCLNDPGTGKTSAAAWAADYLLTRGAIKRVLIICPLSIMDTAWRADLFRTVMHRSVAIATGSRRQREAIIQGDAEFVIINFDGVKVVPEALRNGGFDLIIIDEATALKSASTDRWKAVNSLVTPSTWIWAMTGTPAAQSPEDAYGVAKLVRPESVPRHAGSWRDRVMVKITQFKWVPKMNAQQTVYNTLQPAIRFTKEECLDLPDILYTTREVPLTAQQNKYYARIKQEMVALAAGEEITAANAASMLNKLLQLSCIAYNTEVLTDAGWVPIQFVTPQHRVWDGAEWVAQQGAVFRGVKPLVSVAGVRMTADHKVWVGEWVTAQEIVDGDARSRFDRTEVRFPDGFGKGSSAPSQKQNRKVGLPMRLRHYCGAAESISTGYNKKAASELRLPPRKRDPRYEPVTPVQHMGVNAFTMHAAFRQGLEKLRCAGYIRLRSVAGVVRELLGRYAAWVQRRVVVGSDRRKRSVQPGELPLGYCDGAIQQYALQSLARYPERAYDCDASRANLRGAEGNAARSTVSVQLASGESSHYAGTERVYDLVNCGPRNRFVVRGSTGTPVIVHNCGAVYTDTGEVVEFDMKPRLSELLGIIDGTDHKVLVFVPFRHVTELLHDALTQHFGDPRMVEVIQGGVSAGARAETIKRFQTEDTPKVLLLSPQATAHGITLTRADQIVWWGPIASTEYYLQANARAHRAGQTNKVTVTHLQGSPVERRMYSMLQGKIDLHQSLVELYKQEIL